MSLSMIKAYPDAFNVIQSSLHSHIGITAATKTYLSVNIAKTFLVNFASSQGIGGSI
jgi:hypothetical protein